MSAHAIEALFHQARLERTRGDLAAAEVLLERACSHEGPEGLRVRAAWKWSKARADRGATDAAIDALRSTGLPLFDGAYPRSFHGARRLARLHQETLGYASPHLLWLWDALLVATRRHQDDDAVEAVLLERAWCHLVRGDRASMDEDLNGVEHHESAALYTRLCAANWALDATAAAELVPLLSAGAVHEETALFEAALRFGTPAPAPTGRTPYLKALAAGHGFRDLPEQLRADGPEFALAAHQSAVLAGEREPPTELWGCTIFAPC